MAIQIMEISLGYLSKNTYLCPENLRFRFMQDTNILYQFFPRSMGLTEPMEDVVNVFKEVEDKISSSTNDLRSDDVLSIVRPGLKKSVIAWNKTRRTKGKSKFLFFSDTTTV